MHFAEADISSLNLANPRDLALLLVTYMCAEKYCLPLRAEEEALLSKFIKNKEFIEKGLNYQQFNELLLLLNQDRISDGFFRFFFGEEPVRNERLKEGIVKLRGFAMLRFGDFRFAFKRLARKDQKAIAEELLPYTEAPKLREDMFRGRPPKILDIDPIDRNKTWYLGSISGRRIRREEQELKSRIEAGNFSGLQSFEAEMARIGKEVEETQKKALTNTDVYLTWDYMDIYIATSMRHSWEYEQAYDFINGVFTNPDLDFRGELRYFDPTQSLCKNARDKGLVEGLMLKRALCTIYLAQESDTLGKDCELAATLAQGKPVIAYVPQHEPGDYAKTIGGYALHYFKRRLQILDAEEVFDEPACLARLRGVNEAFESVIGHFLDEYEKYRKEQPFSLWQEKDEEFKAGYKDFEVLCNIVATAECFNYDNRAGYLGGGHPLSMQVNLQDGVANGVLVVRKADDCAKLLRRILTNEMDFQIKHEKDKNGKDMGDFFVLEEEYTKSPFRVVTQYDKLANSFWNLFA